MQNNVEIVAAHTDDAAAIVAIEHEYWRAHYVNEAAGITAEDVDKFLARSLVEEQVIGWQVLINGSETIEFLAKQSGEVVGYISLEKEPVPEINQLHIKTAADTLEVRQALLDTALDFIGRDKLVQTRVAEFDDVSKQFFVSNRFVETDEVIKEFAFSSGALLPEIKMVRQSEASHSS